MPAGALGGVLSIAATIAVAAALISLLLQAGRIWLAGQALLQRVGLLPAPPPRPVGMPMERIAHDLRRLRVQTVHRPGEPWARHRGIVAAYDDALGDACRALGIETDLAELAPGLDRDGERLRVEAAVERAGIDLGPRVTG